MANLGSPPIFSHVFLQPLLTFPKHFIDIHLYVASGVTLQTEKGNQLHVPPHIWLTIA